MAVNLLLWKKYDNYNVIMKCIASIVCDYITGDAKTALMAIPLPHYVNTRPAPRKKATPCTMYIKTWSHDKHIVMYIDTSIIL